MLKIKNEQPDQAAERRRLAEEVFGEEVTKAPENLEAILFEETRQTFHELRVHQIELEMQTEESLRKQVELDAARARYFDLYDLAPAGYVTISEQGLILEANLTAATLLGVARGVLMKQPMSRFIFKKDQGLYYLHCKKLFKTRTPQAWELRMVKLDGTEFWVYLTATVAQELSQSSGQDADGALVVRVVLSDITERKRVEEILLQEKERLAITLRSISEGIITTDINGAIVLMNKAAEEMTGWKTEDAAGRPLAEVFVSVNEFTRVRCENLVEKVLRSGSTVDLDSCKCLISKNGREIVIAESGAPIHDSGNCINGVVIVFRDMAEKQKLNDSMQREQKLESIGILAGGIAHDFNNMLAGIFGYLEMAKDSAAESKFDHIPKYLNKALSVFDRAKGLTQQLLTFSKGGTPIRKTMQLAPLIQHSANFALSGSNVTCQFQLVDNLRLCDCDENQIGQVIDNIVINAKQAMPMGGNIVISADNVTDQPGHPGNFVRISIKDQGVGMPKEILSKIFDPFFSTKETGHGLGLATVFSIIKRHDGWIDVESKPGKGSTFHIFIHESQKTVYTGTVHETVEHRGSGTILVMDDEEYMLEIAGTMLQNMGYAVARAKNGNEALAFFTNAERSGRPFIASILDLTIPGGTGGKEAAAAIKKINPKSIIIASSGYSEDPIIANPTEHGFTDKITKPYRKNDLTELLNRILKNRP